MFLGCCDWLLEREQVWEQFDDPFDRNYGAKVGFVEGLQESRENKMLWLHEQPKEISLACIRDGLWEIGME